MKHVGIALLGLGVVGSGTYKIIIERHDAIAEQYGIDLEVVCVLEKDLSKADALGLPRSMVWGGIEEVCASDKVNIIAEFFGGTRPARDFLCAALRAGKSVVTSNKELLAKHLTEMEQCAAASGAGIYFEASCVGGVPVIRAIEEGCQANQITELKGIVNGTTNYILTKMSQNNESYGKALAAAQSLGYAEANPAADVEGFDSVYKLSILSSLAFKRHIDYTDIYREGITKITAEDIAFANANNYAIKLLAIAKSKQAGIEAHVFPCLIPSNHMLSCVSDSFNALYITGNNVGDLMLYGRGAGALPTGSAIVSDIVYAAQKTCITRYPFITSPKENVLTDFECGCFIRATAFGDALEKELDALGCDIKKTSFNGEAIYIVEKITQSRIAMIGQKYSPLSIIRIEN